MKKINFELFNTILENDSMVTRKKVFGIMESNIGIVPIASNDGELLFCECRDGKVKYFVTNYKFENDSVLCENIEQVDVTNMNPRQELRSVVHGILKQTYNGKDPKFVKENVVGAIASYILNDGLVNFLFVGRIAPNKRIEDHLRLAEHYKRYIDAYYRFIFVGRHDVVPRYYSMIRALVSEYRMRNDRFIFTGPVPDEELAVYYRHAAVYISLSEHEGFCVPLVEAMAADVPVLAYAAAAVPDTLGGAGVQFAPKDLEYAAELLGMLAFDDGLRASVIAGQRRRLQEFGDDRMRRDLDAILRQLRIGALSVPHRASGGAPLARTER